MSLENRLPIISQNVNEEDSYLPLVRLSYRAPENEIEIKHDNKEEHSNIL